MQSIPGNQLNQLADFLRPKEKRRTRCPALFDNIEDSRYSSCVTVYSSHIPRRGIPYTDFHPGSSGHLR